MGVVPGAGTAARPMSERLCENCRTPLVRKVFPCGSLERPKQFAARRFCDGVCSRMKVKPKHSPNHPWKLAGLKTLEKARGNVR